MNQESKSIESLIESFIQEEINAIVLEEGLVDIIKNAWQKTKGATSQAWNRVQGSLAQSSNTIKTTVNKASEILNGIFPQVKQQFEFIKQVEQATGEKINYDNTLNNLQKVAMNAKSIADVINKESEQTINLAKQAATQTQQEAIQRKFDEIFNESINEMKMAEGQKQLNEVGIIGAVGLGLGTFGGIKLLMGGLSKLFAKFDMPKAQKLSDFFHSAHEKLHHLEISALDKIVPNRVAFAFYQAFSKKFSKGTPLTFEQFVENQETRERVKKYIYAVLLLTLFIIGVTHLLHASYNFINAAEGAANTVKAIEVGEAVVDAAGVMTGAGSEMASSAGELAVIASELGAAVASET